MTQNSPPSRNPANNGTFVGLLELLKTKLLQNFDDMLPAQVIGYDRASNRAQVQPMIVVVTTDNQQVQRAQIASVPVFRFGGGGFASSFPLKAGDLGWIKANDRDISILKQTGQSSAPNTQRKHSFEDALFIPDIWYQILSIANEDLANFILQNYSGTVKISMSEEYINLTAPGVGIGGPPDPNAVLDVQSTSKAFKFPTMTTAQKNAISNPQEGFAVYDTNQQAISTYNGSAWS